MFEVHYSLRKQGPLGTREHSEEGAGAPARHLPRGYQESQETRSMLQPGVAPWRRAQLGGFMCHHTRDFTIIPVFVDLNCSDVCAEGKAAAVEGGGAPAPGVRKESETPAKQLPKTKKKKRKSVEATAAPQGTELAYGAGDSAQEPQKKKKKGAGEGMEGAQADPAVVEGAGGGDDSEPAQEGAEKTKRKRKAKVLDAAEAASLETTGNAQVVWADFMPISAVLCW